VVPSSVAGAAIFVVLLTPGLLYVLRRERTALARPASPFRETLRVVAVSIASLLAASLIVALARAMAPGTTVDVGALLRDPDTYAVDHHVGLAWWSLGTVAMGCAIALAAADPRLARRARAIADRPAMRKVLGTRDTDIRSGSSWSRVFGMYDDHPHGPGDVVVGALLEDGAYVQGILSSHSPEPDETTERDLVLKAPITLRTTNGKLHQLPATYTIVSAGRVLRLDVQHIAPPAPG
jgi:hypothetical protein